MATVLIDTDVFVRIFRGDASLKQKVDALDAGVSAIVYLELLQGALNKRQARDTEAYLARFALLHLTPSISARAIDIVRSYSQTSGLRLADALIAATCLEENLPLLSFNIKDFRQVQGLTLMTI